MPATHNAICIVGAGQAGCEVVLGLRRNGWAGPILLIGEESHPPYQRPALSKACLKADVDRHTLYLRQLAVFERLGVELLLDSRVDRIDPAAATIDLANGEVRRYTQLALTTGGRPRRLSIEGARQAERCGKLHYLRTIDDVERIRPRFVAGTRLVIIGGGYVGLEVASAAITCGLKVTVLEASPRVLARVTAPEMSRFYEQAHREAGVDVRTGADVTGIDACAGALMTVACSDGSTLDADLIVAGVGLVPNTELAQAAGLAVDDGIVVDEHARTSDPRIVAAGDCTNHPNPWSGRRIRLESVANAVEQGRTAAATLTGRQRPYDAVPWFWSDQYDLKLQIAGLSRGYDQVVLRGSMSSRSFVMFYLRNEQVIACDAVNRPAEFMIAKRLVGGRCIVDPALLRDESATLQGPPHTSGKETARSRSPAEAAPAVPCRRPASCTRRP